MVKSNNHKKTRSCARNGSQMNIFLLSFPKFDLMSDATYLLFPPFSTLWRFPLRVGGVTMIDLDHNNEQWSLIRHIDVHNARINKLRPNCLISSLQNWYGGWKASEIKTFYSLPLSEDSLLSKYYDHFCT